jgi:type II secretion system protein C
MDRRHALRIRALSVVGGACLAVAALWSAGLPPVQWWSVVRQWVGRADLPPEQAIATSAPAVPPSTNPADDMLKVAASGAASSDRHTVLAPRFLYLIATTPGRNEHEGTALIGTDRKNAQTYLAGALLANRARLVEVHKDYVLLARDGQTVRLGLSDRNDRRQVVDPLLTIEPSAAPSIVQAQRETNLTDVLRPTPVYDGEQLQGYEVQAGSRPGLLARLGLQPGDMITSVNEQPLNDPQVAIDLLQELLAGRILDATVLRKNKIERVTLDGGLILAEPDVRGLRTQLE